jgi:DNA-binding response OmpR family regulator
MTAILIVGDDPVLLETRAYLLRDWQVSATTSKDAAEAIRAKSYDLIIFCQTIPNEIAHTLITDAREMNPNVSALSIHLPGQAREVDANLYETHFQDPGRLRSVVAHLLQSSVSG